MHAKKMGVSMNQAIVELLQTALADLPSGFRGAIYEDGETKDNLEKEIKFLWSRIDSLNEDISNFSSSIANANGENESEISSYRKFLLKRIHETDLESDELLKKVKALEARLKSIQNQ